jgi:hypothetical protein
MKKIFYFFIAVLLFASIFSCTSKSFAQQDNDILSYLKNFKFHSYVDAYYAFDSDKDKSLRQFSSLSPYRDEFRLNIAQLSLTYNTDNIRGTFTMHFGDIPRVNWPYNNQYVQEANIGFSPYKNLWIDAGYFLTHIGCEGLPKNNNFSSFSLQSYYEPFFQSGVKISYDFSDKFFACLHILNGYNVLDDNNKNKSAGLQLTYTLNPDFKVTYNNLIGNEMPAEMNGKTRFFNNLIFNISPLKKVDVVAGFDFGLQEKSNLIDSSTAYVYGAMASVKYQIHPKFSTSIRAEFYQDLNGVLSGILANNMGAKGNGITLGVEYNPVESAYIRLESRYLRMDANQKIFYNNDNERTEVIMSFGLEY